METNVYYYIVNNNFCTLGTSEKMVLGILHELSPELQIDTIQKCNISFDKNTYLVKDFNGARLAHLWGIFKRFMGGTASSTEYNFIYFLINKCIEECNIDESQQVNFRHFIFPIKMMESLLDNMCKE